MGFEVVQGTSPMTLWCPLVKGDTCYVGQIVYSNNEGVSPIGAASGVADITNKRIPFGVVVGTNLYNQSFDATNAANAITDVVPLASTVDYRMIENEWVKGDKVSMVQVAVITPETILKGPLYNGALGTAPSLLTVTTAGTVTSTTNATDASGVDSLATLYMRTGAAAGAYRVTDDTSTTALEWDQALTITNAIGDTAVRVNGLRNRGNSRIQFDSEALYIDVAAALTADYYSVEVYRLDLETATKEHCYFRFNTYHFNVTDDFTS